MKKPLLSAIVLSVGLLIAGCGSQGAATNESSNKSKESKDQPVKIVAVGSTALQPLVDAAKDQFISEHPNYTISVQGGGSGTGLSQVADGAVTIGNSDVFAEEKSGVDASKLVDHRVAVVGMGPVVNKEVGVKNVTKQELIDIFTGKTKNWKELGGKDQEIAVINRPSGSGTRATFEKWGLDGATAVQSQEQDSSGTVRQIVAQTPGAISYLAFSYMDDSTIALSVDDVKPTEENVADNSWKIWSYEHMYTKGEPDKEVKAFLDFMLEEDVQKGVVKELGYLPITDMKVERDVSGTIKEK
ncbi:MULTISPECIES: phosphate ABC transporter substrate-binding protein PstS family protein [unclassified Enterococcus]|uniref:phosphate ABC transporter substrate-binding protein PstS family protein n=1 Tax=unclassified Enterococcus TaxID=2608891 RepID=UPI001CE1E6C6|nr:MULTISPECIES: phosphate ABC transporter substrate-binding protein PstS family protein [unclassified Enterococcus]MCA5012892.1 phosphate ABC transporter substrate-binding protein PstS family protein [Enterococcus sp. S23]MCA5016143.1 phosphate ABC transporter substrate-binding protein PstS family protein [Enterococcus sp. S22(2020)]